jgi:hypothetical protein
VSSWIFYGRPAGVGINDSARRDAFRRRSRAQCTDCNAHLIKQRTRAKDMEVNEKTMVHTLTANGIVRGSVLDVSTRMIDSLAPGTQATGARGYPGRRG